MSTTHDCRRVEPDLVEYAYGGLEPDERARVATELATCATCRAALDGMVEVQAALDALALASEPVALDGSPRRATPRGWLLAAGVLVAVVAGGLAGARSWLSESPSATPRIPIAARPAPPTSDPAPTVARAASTDAQLARIQHELEAVIHLQLALQRLTHEAHADHVGITHPGVTGPGGTNPEGFDR